MRPKTLVLAIQAGLESSNYYSWDAGSNRKLWYYPYYYYPHRPATLRTTVYPLVEAAAVYSPGVKYYPYYHLTQQRVEGVFGAAVPCLFEQAPTAAEARQFLIYTGD